MVIMLTSGNCIINGMSGNMLKDNRDVSFHTEFPTKRARADHANTKITNFVILEPRVKYAVYKVTVVASEDKEWVVHKRYSDFEKLNKKLQILFPNVVLKLPAKRYFGDNFNHHFIMKRQQGLERYITTVLSMDIFHNSKPVQRFFRLDNPPGANEDLDACHNYCLGLEKKCEELDKQVQCQEMEISRLKQVNNQLINKLLLTESDLMQQLAEVNFAVDEEFQRLNQEYQQLEIYASAIQYNERNIHKQQIREQKEVFINKQEETQNVFNDISTSLTDIRKVNTNEDGQIINLNPIDIISEKERELKNALAYSLAVLQSLYAQHVFFYQTELQEVKVKCVKYEKSLQSCQRARERLASQLKKYEERPSSNGSLVDWGRY